jgi:hypothetical protein
VGQISDQIRQGQSFQPSSRVAQHQASCVWHTCSKFLFKLLCSSGLVLKCTNLRELWPFINSFCLITVFKPVLLGKQSIFISSVHDGD